MMFLVSLGFWDTTFFFEGVEHKFNNDKKKGRCDVLLWHSAPVCENFRAHYYLCLWFDKSCRMRDIGINTINGCQGRNLYYISVVRSPWCFILCMRIPFVTNFHLSYVLIFVVQWNNCWTRIWLVGSIWPWPINYCSLNNVLFCFFCLFGSFLRYYK